MTAGCRKIEMIQVHCISVFYWIGSCRQIAWQLPFYYSIEKTQRCKRGIAMEENKKTTEAEGMQADALVKKMLRRQRILIGTLGAVVVIGGTAVFGYMKGWFGSEKADKEVTAQVDPNAEDWDGSVPDAPKGNAKAESIAIPGYPRIQLPAGQTEVELLLGNPEGNPCFFEYTLVLKDTNELLYESQQIPPGEAVAKVSLSKPLDAGEYPAVLKISTKSIQTQEEMNGANVETLLEVQ